MERENLKSRATTLKKPRMDVTKDNNAPDIIEGWILIRRDATFAELQSISQYYKGYAEWYAERSINYLTANNTLYPEYLNPGSDVTTIQPVSNQYKVAINLGRGDYEDYRPYSERYQGNRYKKPF